MLAIIFNCGAKCLEIIMPCNIFVLIFLHGCILTTLLKYKLEICYYKNLYLSDKYRSFFLKESTYPFQRTSVVCNTQ